MKLTFSTPPGGWQPTSEMGPQGGKQSITMTVTCLHIFRFLLCFVDPPILVMASAKSVLALCWKAELNINTAVLVQKRIARIPPNEVQGSSDNQYPYTVYEMEWQLDFIQNPK